MKTAPFSDKELFRQIARNDSAAFEILFKTYYPCLASMLMKYSNDPEQIKDWIQEIYVKVWNNRESLEPEHIENVKGYFIVLARNHVIKRLAKKKQVKLVYGSLAAEQDIEDNNLQENLDHNELWKAYRSAVKKLPPRTREAFFLNREKGMSYHKVAEALGISVKTVEVQISRALVILRKELVSFSAYA